MCTHTQLQTWPTVSYGATRSSHTLPAAQRVVCVRCEPVLGAVSTLGWIECCSRVPSSVVNAIKVLELWL